MQSWVPEEKEIAKERTSCFSVYTDITPLQSLARYPSYNPCFLQQSWQVLFHMLSMSQTLGNKSTVKKSL